MQLLLRVAVSTCNHIVQNGQATNTFRLHCDVHLQGVVYRPALYRGRSGLSHLAQVGQVAAHLDCFQGLGSPLLGCRCNLGRQGRTAGFGPQGWRDHLIPRCYQLDSCNCRTQVLGATKGLAPVAFPSCGQPFQAQGCGSIRSILTGLCPRVASSNFGQR